MLDTASDIGARVLVVGGAGALRSPGERDLLVAEDPAYIPAEYRAVAAAGIAQLGTCRSHSADWIYLSPPGSNRAPAPAATTEAPTPCSPHPTAAHASAPRTWP
ncbi:hypothetical protein ABZX38_32845 [Streptomyces longwoodensis]|uniref:hypothetical protein n=1 Tax=Streptomyces longwoodensis TaxID=68231 RepID=UPI0033A6D178